MANTHTQQLTKQKHRCAFVWLIKTYLRKAKVNLIIIGVFRFSRSDTKIERTGSGYG